MPVPFFRTSRGEWQTATLMRDDATIRCPRIAVMTFSRRCCLALLWILLAACAAPSQRAIAPQATTAAPASPATVILISIDGYRADYLQRGLSPSLAMLAARGVRAQWMTPSFPSLTFPNHYTLVTGLYPDHHGIVANTMEDARLGRFSLSNRRAVSDERWWDQATPLWVDVQRQGGHAATMFWPGSEAPIHGVRPDHWLPFDAKMPPEARVDKVLQWLDLPPVLRPRFITLYFDAVDHQAHEHGPDSTEVDEALRRTDAALGRLIDGLKQRGLFDRVDLVIVSDHGMAPVSPGHLIFLDTLADLGKLRVVVTGPIAELGPAVSDDASRDAVKKLLAPHPHLRCWRKQDIPRRFHYGTHPRIPPWVCLAQTGWLITTHQAVAARAHPPRGEHGYDNFDPLMRALFIAEGPAFQRDVVVAPFPNVDVYPLLAHLLRITSERNDGDYAAVQAMLKAQ